MQADNHDVHFEMRLAFAWKKHFQNLRRAEVD